MKREHWNMDSNTDPYSGCSASTMAAVSGKLWEEEDGGCMDELLAVLGYKVRSSDMADVAQKLEQLEQVIGHVQEDGGLSHLGSATVHYNPADLSTWLQSMITELNPLDPLMAPSATPSLPNTSSLDGSSTITSLDFIDAPPMHRQNQISGFEVSSPSDYHLQAIPGKAIFPQSQIQFDDPPSRENKRLKTSSLEMFQQQPPPSVGSYPVPTALARPVILVDSQENGVRLVHALMACAESVQENNLRLAEALVKQIGYFAASQAGAMRKVATYFAEALARRIYKLYPENPIDHGFSELLQMHFYESCPYLKFAHFTANQAILEAFEGKNRVHVVDFSMNQGMQWPALMQALAVRPGGPPAFRLTGIGPPAPDNADHLQEVGWKLAQLAEAIHVEFEYRGFVANSLADLDASMLELRPSEVEAVAVNSVFELHKPLARPAAIEKVLNVIKQMKPVIFTIAEQESNHNGPVFMDRFTESLHYYSTLFDSLEGSSGCQDKVMSEVYLGKQICNVVACEGVDRVERHETLSQWQKRLGSAGFDSVHLGSNAFKQASMLLALYASGEGYRVEENNGCLMLGWHTRPLIATSAWRLANSTAAVVAH